MSSTTASNRTGSDFVRLRDLDKREEKFDENIHALLEENGLYRKRIPKGPSSLLRAISDSLFYTQNQYEEVKESLISYLTQLVASNKLTPRLSGFKCNSMMLNDFVNNPGLPGFEKTILELVSLMHNARVVLYTMNEEHFLTATIFNSNFTKTIEFLRTKTSHYDVVFSKSKVDKLTYCQNIVLNMIEQASSGSAELKLEGLKDLNNGEFHNIAYENSLLPSAASPKDADGFRITRGQHKKSLSDNFNTNFEQMEEQQLKFLDAFRSAAPADDETFEDANIRKESGFSINANFDFMDEQNLDAPFTSEFAIKNYPVKIPLQTRNVPINETDSPMPTFSKTKFSNHPNVLFNENPSITEIERINSATTKGSRQPDASPYYINLGSAPGLSPSRYGPQRTFSETSDFLISPTLPREAISPLHAYGGHTPSRNMPVSPFAQNYAGVAEQGFSLNPVPLGAQRHYSDNTPSQIAQQSQVFSPHHSQFSSLYMKRSATGASSSTTVPRTEEVSAFEQPPGLTGPIPFEKEQKAFDEQEVIIGYDQFGNVIREKRKPIVIDESKERFNGRLKFFDEHKKYGFIVMDEDGSDIFVHFDDLAKANVPKELLRTVRTGNVLRFNFGLMDYVGKYNRSRKAIEIQLLA